ncbi:MAG: DUF2283 domain-containing protein, partial [Candidatus Aenigmatarchaeota archaeon]
NHRRQLVGMEISYDEEADVLYLTFRECKNVETEHEENGILVRKNMETGEIVGYTIMYISEKERISLPDKEEPKVPA